MGSQETMPELKKKKKNTLWIGGSKPAGHIVDVHHYNSFPSHSMGLRNSYNSNIHRVSYASSWRAAFGAHTFKTTNAASYGFFLKKSFKSKPSTIPAMPWPPDVATTL